MREASRPNNKPDARDPPLGKPHCGKKRYVGHRTDNERVAGHSNDVAPNAPNNSPVLETVVVADLLAPASDGVIWAGEHKALAARREKEAFVSQLLALGYETKQFRVTVRDVSPDTTVPQRYTVLVAQLQGTVPYTGKRFVGGHGFDWIHDFSRTALADFPRDLASPDAPSPMLERIACRNL